MNVITEIARFGLKIMFHRRFKFKFTYEDFDPKRKEPYILIFTHTQLNDPLFVGMYLKYYPYPVASNTLYTNKIMRLALTKLVKSIPKRKGQADSRTIRMIIDAFNKDRRGIMIAPEGNSSFYGEQTPTDYLTTAKLVKKLDKDLVVAQINGGFFADPRWGKYRKRAIIEVNYKPLIKQGEFKDLPLEKVIDILDQAIKFNDYEWIKNRDYTYKSKTMAEGIEHIIYACPVCGKLQTISTSGNDIFCSHCGKISEVDEKQFLSGQYKTLIDWNTYQKQVIKKHINDKFETTGQLYELDLIHEDRLFKGDYEISLNKNEFKLKNEAHEFKFDIELMNGMTITQKNKLSFDYEAYTYLIKMNHSMLFHDLIKLKRGEKL